MDQKIIFLSIVGMALVTYIPRVVPMLALASKSLHPAIENWLSFIPTAVLSAMLAPALLVEKGTMIPMTENYYLWSAIPAFWVSWKYKSFFGAVAVGMGLVAGFRFFMG